MDLEDLDAKVVVANADIALGSAVNVDQLATRDVPVTAAPVNGFSDPAQLVGRVVRRDVRKDHFSAGSAVGPEYGDRPVRPAFCMNMPNGLSGSEAAGPWMA